MPSRAIPPGVGSVFEMGMRFARWASTQRAVPSTDLVMRTFNVSRATAYRYLDAYRNFASVAGVIQEERPTVRPPAPAVTKRRWQWRPESPRSDTVAYVLLPMKAPPDRPASEGVSGRVGMHPSTIYAEIKAGRFPKPTKFGRSSRWVESEIDAYIVSRVHQRDDQSQDGHPSAPTVPRTSRALIDLKETMRRSGLCKSAIYDRMADGTFPKACKIGVSTRWVDAEVDAWVDQRIGERDR